MRKFISDQLDSFTVTVVISLITISIGLVFYINVQFIDKLFLHDAQQVAKQIAMQMNLEPLSELSKQVDDLKESTTRSNNNKSTAKNIIYTDKIPAVSNLINEKELFRHFLSEVNGLAIYVSTGQIFIPKPFQKNKNWEPILKQQEARFSAVLNQVHTKSIVHSNMKKQDEKTVHYMPLKLGRKQIPALIVIEAKRTPNGYKVAHTVNTAIKATILGGFLIISLVICLITARLTENIRAKKLIQYLVNNDALTNLLNRKGYYKKISQLLKDEKAEPKEFAALAIDLDRFGQINDLHGQNVGDEILKIIGQRIEALMPPSATLARMSGDEFSMILPSVATSQEATVWANNISQAICEPIEIEEETFVLYGSVGITFGPDEAKNAEDLYKRVNIALSRAKEDGGNTHRFYAPEMDSALHARQSLERDLHQALRDNEFELFYQPQHNIVSNEIVGYEALIRWRHPKKGYISPADFIPIAEDTGLIVPMGEQILRRACREAMMWKHPLIVAVNLSPIQFAHQDIPELVALSLDETGLPPSRLELEITESTLLSRTEHVLKMLTELKLLGVNIAMDDFGTGYSSLGYISQFDFDKIKIDQSFVSTILEDERARAIISTITGLGRALDITITAEGIENEEQLMMLRAAGCNVGQGFFYGKAQPQAVVLDQTAKLAKALAKAS